MPSKTPQKTMRQLCRATLLILLCSFVTAVSAADSFYDKLQVTDIDGSSVDLNTYKGGIVLVNFWATWCPPCIKEMPSMQRLQQQFEPEKFQIVAINMGQSATTVESFLMEQSFEFDLPVYLDDMGRAFTDMKIQGMPSSFLLDTNGNLIETIVGAREWDHPGNVEALQALIDKSE
ncbi:MAG: TlpA family protein disulfide reductase [Amphritea sp.]|nr:TlpA family protein disulfide reductase [Amphritea sp.]